MGESDRKRETTGTMRERVWGGRTAVWFLVEGNRLVVTAVLLAVGYLVLVLLSLFAPGSATKLFDPDPVFALFTPVVIGIIMGVSLVLTFNQLVLSQELGPAGKQRQRMQEAIDFRKDIEDAVGQGTSPPEPSAFLRGLVDATGNRASAILDEIGTEGTVDDELIEYVETIEADAERISDSLRGGEFGEFEVIKAALNYNYSWKIYDGRRVRTRNAESISEDLGERLDELIDILEFFGPAREHFKTLYFRWEIINVSKALVYLAIPGLAIAAYMILLFQPDAIAGTTWGLDNVLLFTGLAFGAGIAPFVVFLSYILRIVTIAKWTLAIGPFALRKTGREDEDIGWG